jgi:dTDP-L-rhamnose 4-epimerase
MREKKVLITGGAGFIGANLSLHLIKKGYEVTVLDNLSPQIHGMNAATDSPLYQSIKDKVHFINGTVTSKSDWLKAIDDNTVIVHLAAETGTGQSMYQIERYVQVNIGGTALMLDILANEKTAVKKIIIASSRAIYGEGKYLAEDETSLYPLQRQKENLDKGFFEVTYEGYPGKLKLMATDEESKIHPSSVYGITKQNQEQLVMTVCPSIGIQPVAFRYQNVYGPGQSLSNPYTGILSIFSTQIKNKKGINIFEDGYESRDFVFIDDVVQATILGIEEDAANAQVFNVGAGIPTTVLQVARTLISSYGEEVPLQVTGNYRSGDIRHNYADITKIKRLLGFNPSVSFEEGIRLFTLWVNNQDIKKSRYDESLKELKEKGLMK